MREAVGADYRLMLDSTWSYSYPEALRVGRALEELAYYWYEDPLDDDDITNYVKLRAEARHPHPRDRILTRPLVRRTPRGSPMQATDILRGDVAVRAASPPCSRSLTWPKPST